LLDGGKSNKGESRYREIAWKLEERGSMGENLAGVCLMQVGTGIGATTIEDMMDYIGHSGAQRAGRAAV